MLRVLSRLCAVAASPKEPNYCGDGKLAWRLARELVEAGGGTTPGDLNQGIMELGATLCAPSSTQADCADPLYPWYRTVAIGREAYEAHDVINKSIYCRSARGN